MGIVRIARLSEQRHERKSKGKGAAARQRGEDRGLEGRSLI